MSNQLIINDSNYRDFINPVVDGEVKMQGLIPRNYTTHPRGCYGSALAVDFPTIPRTEWSARIKEKVALKSQLSDIRMRGNNGSRIPSLDQNGKGYCVKPGTLIRMADGTQRAIESIKMLEKVVSGEGNVRRVMQCHVREYDGEIVTIKAYGHNLVQLTPNHSVWTKRGYVPAGELTSDDWISIPKCSTVECGKIVQTALHVNSFRTKVYSKSGVSEYRGENNRKLLPIPDFIHLNYNVGRIFGFWLAEGSCKSRKKGTGAVVWSFGTEKKGHLIDELVRLIKEEFGVKAKVRRGRKESVTNVFLGGVLWQELFVSLLGRMANGKRLHPDIVSGPKEFLEGLFWGWMDCDGTKRKNTGKRADYTRGCTVSHSLALSMYDIANSFELCPTILKENPQENDAAKTRQSPYKLTVIPSPSKLRRSYRHESEDGRVWRKVFSLDRENYKGLVYNIGVEVDNSYIAEGVHLKNCWAHSTTQAVMMLRAEMGQPYVPLSAYAVACVIKNYRDEGGWGALSLDFATSRGIPSQEFWPQQSMDRSNDNPNTWKNAALHKVSEGFVDLAVAAYDRTLSFDQVATCLLCNIPVVGDFNWWGHSVCLLDLVEIESGDFGVRILNSWSDSWSDNGMGILQGSKCVPDGAVAPRVTLPTAA